MKCSICGNNAGLSASRTNNGDWLCGKCLKRVGGLSAWSEIKRMSVEEIRSRIGDEPSSDFTPTVNIDNVVLIDENKRLVQFPQVALRSALKGSSNNKKLYRFEDIMNCEIIENGGYVSKGGLGVAAAGALAFGETGAIVGSLVGRKNTSGTCESLRVKVTVNDLNNPAVFIDLISTKTLKSSSKYKNAAETAEKIASAFEVLKSR